MDRMTATEVIKSRDSFLKRKSESDEPTAFNAYFPVGGESFDSTVTCDDILKLANELKGQERLNTAPKERFSVTPTQPVFISYSGA